MMNDFELENVDGDVWAVRTFPGKQRITKLAAEALGVGMFWKEKMNYEEAGKMLEEIPLAARRAHLEKKKMKKFERRALKEANKRNR